MNQDYKVVGREIKRIIADDIVTGKAVFTDDLRVTGMVYGKVLRSPYPHARITRIDADRAKACEDVYKRQLSGCGDGSVSDCSSADERGDEHIKKEAFIKGGELHEENNRIVYGWNYAGKCSGMQQRNIKGSGAGRTGFICCQGK